MTIVGVSVVNSITAVRTAGSVIAVRIATHSCKWDSALLHRYLYRILLITRISYILVSHMVTHC